jgi:arylsulfatase A-like enzyme
MKKILLFSASLLVFTGVLFGRMNVIFFLVDDLGYHDLSLTGSSVYETPRIDELAGDGTLLTQAHAAFPRCVPSRYAMMTGVHPSRAESVGERPGNMDPNRVTIAEALKAHGYSTFFAGKWHIGKKPDVNFPDAQGFDINIAGGTAGAPGSYWYPYPPEKKLTGPENLDGKEGDYLTDALTDKTVEFIEGHAEEPFFVFLSHYAVHTPIQGKPEKTKRYQEKIDGLGFEGDSFFVKEWTGRERRYQDNAEYAAMIESVDESLGRIIDSLKAKGIYDETIIILTSDHGGLSNAGVNNKRPLATSNYPLRAGKGHMYDGGLRVPVIVHWPGKVIPGTRVDFSITGMDYYPTILEMLGLPQQPEDHIDGVSFVTGLLGNESLNKERSLFWYSDIGRLKSTGDRNAAVIRKGNYKLMEFFQDAKIELYDISVDPGEQNDLSKEFPEVCKSLLTELRDWKKQMKVKDRAQTWGN